MEYKVPCLYECRYCIYFRDIGKYGFCTNVEPSPLYYDNVEERVTCKYYIADDLKKEK